MKYSIFTPTNDAKYLLRAYESLLSQTEQDWEWILIPNNGCVIEPMPDPRVKVIPYESDKVGALKKYACSQASGEWLIELDHDDELLPTCLEEIGKSSADFVYSNCVQVNSDWTPVVWAGANGWEWRPVNVRGHECLECVSPEPYPTNLGRIWFAPNHVRAWRHDFYDRIGGHDDSMFLSDDHDLVARSMLNGIVEHIDKPLYLYWVHGENTWLHNTQWIQDTMWQNYDRHFIKMQEKWSRDNGLSLVDLGGALDCPQGYISVDRHNSQLNCDLNGRWPLEDESVGVLRAHDIVEHLVDPIHTMNEAWRVLAHGGILDLLVPSTNGVGAWCDPTHRSYWNIRSIRYYTEGGMRRYIEPECYCRFQPIKCVDIDIYDEKIPYVQAHLLALHEGVRYHGVVMI